MNWQQFKQDTIKELLTNISRLSIKVDDKEITDFSIDQELTRIQNKIGLLKDKINKHRLRELNKQQSELC